MRTSGRIPGTGFVFLAMAAFLLSGCVAAGVASVAAGGGLTYAYSKEPPEKTASAAPPGGSYAMDKPVGGLDNRGHPVAASEPSAPSQPTDLVHQTAPVEQVEVQQLQ